MFLPFTSALVCFDLIVSGDFIKLRKKYIFLNKTDPPISITSSSYFNNPFTSLVTDTLRSWIIHLRISILASRVVCGGIPVMSMVSVVSSHGHTVRTYAADRIFLVQNNCASYRTRLMKTSFKNIFMVDKRRNTHIH